MSITREEAIKELERLLSHWDELENGKRSFRWYSKDAVGLAITALRPVSREQVEKVRGEWVRTHSTDNFWTEVWKCSYCGFEDDNGDCFDFCPECGQPKTDEAVQMVMERLEALHGQETE